MSLIFKNLRVHQIFGANTDVGKTILTTALVRASASRDVPVHYLKPVSTGPMSDADDKHVEHFAGAHRANVQTACLFRFDEPVSPHLAVQLAKNDGKNRSVPSDATFITSIAHYMRRCAMASTKPSHMYVETAGGVHSPTLSGSTQLDCYRPLFLPTILIGDYNLGGISSTISSYESLLLRGYIVDLVLLFKDAYYRNSEYLSPYFAERGIRVLALDPPHKRLPNPQEERAEMERYYGTLVPESCGALMFDALDHLDECHVKRIQQLDSMPRRALDTLWWPFVQHGLVKTEDAVNIIDSASRDFFSVYNGHRSSASVSSPSPSSLSLLEPQFDGSASWWTQALGHAHPALTLAAARAAGRYGHVMYPQGVHLPALKLAERMVHEGPGKGWAARAFFSDNGSTGMEVALKMALRAYALREGITGSKRKRLGVLGLKGSYHGDTIGAMDACMEGVYTCEWHEGKGFWLDPPTVAIRKGAVVVDVPEAMKHYDPSTSGQTMGSLQEAYDVDARLKTPLARQYKAFVEKVLQELETDDSQTLAALVLEPLLMGAGGMIFVDPLFQRVLIDVVRGIKSKSSATSETYQHGLPVVFDEVFIGLYRLGVRSATSILGVNPDISVNAKILTGGLAPLAVTLATDEIFNAFLSENKTDALLHGHSYTAYPIGCEIANETLDIVEKMASDETWDAAKTKWGAKTTAAARQSGIWSLWDRDFVMTISQNSLVSEVMTLGTVLAIKLEDPAAGYQSYSAEKLLQSIRLSYSKDVYDVSTAPGGAPFGVNFRTLGDVAYFMLSLNTPLDVVQSVQNRIWDALKGSSSRTPP